MRDSCERLVPPRSGAIAEYIQRVRRSRAPRYRSRIGASVTRRECASFQAGVPVPVSFNSRGVILFQSRRRAEDISYRRHARRTRADDARKDYAPRARDRFSGARSRAASGIARYVNIFQVSTRLEDIRRGKGRTLRKYKSRTKIIYGCWE